MKDNKNNLLVKKNLRKLIKKSKINNISKDAISLIEKDIQNKFNLMFKELKQEMIINGEKILTKKRIKNYLENKSEEEFEI